MSYKTTPLEHIMSDAIFMTDLCNEAFTKNSKDAINKI